MGGCLVIIAILLLGGVALAFGVPWWGAILILLGIIFAFLLIMVMKESLKTEKGKKVLTIVAVVLVVCFLLFVLVQCLGDVSNDNSGWERCNKCGGDGKVKNDLGFNSTCPRCKGVGYIP